MTVSRRTFLKAGVGAAGLLLSFSDIAILGAQAAKFDPRKKGTSKILVLVQLAGGNDGLNTVIPYSDGAYYKARPSLGIKQESVLHLTPQIGLNPSMTGMADLYKQGKLAIVLGAGYPNPNRSHFRSIEIWQTGDPEKIIDTGWLGRYLDGCVSGKQAIDNKLFPALNVDATLPKTLAGQKVLVPSVSDVNRFKYAADAHFQQDRNTQLDAFRKIYQNFDVERPSVQLIKEAGLNAMDASDYLAKAVASYKDTVSYPDTGFAKGLKFIAQMIVAGVDATVYSISLGGFDTHANQANNQNKLLQQLSEAITVFQKDMEGHALDRDVLLLTFSEFGRRVAQNNGNGTDHGTAEPLFIVGSSVHGGIYGDYPSLTNLDSGDLKYGVDFRSVYATFLDRWLSADSRQILGGKYEGVPFV